MKYFTLLAAVLAFAGNTAAAEQKLTDAEITQLLKDRSLYGDGVEQIFQAAGTTFYLQNGNSSSGSWKVEGGRYCSAWPPNPSWACYDVMQDGDTVTFVSSSGKRFPMRLTK